MLICEDCGKVICEDELGGYYDNDYVDGFCVRHEFVAHNCSCGGEFVEAKKCPMCGEEYIAEGQLVCEFCKDELKEEYGEGWEDYV